MPNAPFYNGNTNPNAKGGAFGYDGRTGLGIGSLTKGPASGIGSNWSMGDALSSPKSEFDYEEKEEVKKFIIDANTTIKELAFFAGLIEEDDFNELEADIGAKAHTSFNRRATDSLAHKSKDISSLGGLGNSIAGVIGLSAGKKLDGDIVSESCLKQYIKELLILEKSTNSISSSGRIASMSSKKASNTGSKRNNDPFGSPDGSTNTSNPPNKKPIIQRKTKNPITGDLGTSMSATNRQGYVQKRDLSTDGGETTGFRAVEKNKADAIKSFDEDGMSTGEELFSLDREEIDRRNVDYNRTK